VESDVDTSGAARRNTRVSATPITYQRQLQDGTVEVYALSDGATAFPRNVFLTQIIDPQGNALTLPYDGQRRVTSVTDAVGRQTTFTYGSVFSLQVTKITDPFGRSATLTNDTTARLSSITDVIGLTSSFTYDANSLVNSMTTPYGTTTFSYTAPGAATPPRVESSKTQLPGTTANATASTRNTISTTRASKICGRRTTTIPRE
jgi:YD repeat-containing protein